MAIGLFFLIFQKIGLFIVFTLLPLISQVEECCIVLNFEPVLKNFKDYNYLVIINKFLGVVLDRISSFLLSLKSIGRNVEFTAEAKGLR